MDANAQHTQVLVIGAGASGLMCAIEAGHRGRQATVLDHGKGPGRKILIAGGGRCNFTNLTVEPKHYLSQNPHFCRSALSRFTQWDFLGRVQAAGIATQERSHTQLFCEHKARDLLDMLLEQAAAANVDFRYDLTIESVAKHPERGFLVRTSQGSFTCESLVVATGGLSIPTVGTSPLGYEIAKQFGMGVVPQRAGLVPFTLQPSDKELLAPLSGIAVPATLSNARIAFTENLLFTHRGLSGPVALQLSSYWTPGEEISIDLLPGCDLSSLLKSHKERTPLKQVKTVLSDLLPRRLLEARLPQPLLDLRLADASHAKLDEIDRLLCRWPLKPGGTEGYRTAEVTLGGVSTDDLSSKTMEARQVPGLYFVGEVVDVTGWLGGYNLQWAWSSGWVAGQYA